VNDRDDKDPGWIDVPVGRRFFLAAGGAAALGAVLAATGCGSGSGPGPDPTGVQVGLVDDFPPDSVTLFSSDRLLVGRDAAGLYAMSAVCTHQGCTLRVGQDRLPCPCHGSAFDFDGAVLNGPAIDPLQHYAVIVDEAGEVRVDRSQPVSAVERTPV